MPGPKPPPEKDVHVRAVCTNWKISEAQRDTTLPPQQRAKHSESAQDKTDIAEEEHRKTPTPKRRAVKSGDATTPMPDTRAMMKMAIEERMPEIGAPQIAKGQAAIREARIPTGERNIRRAAVHMNRVAINSAGRKKTRANRTVATSALGTLDCALCAVSGSASGAGPDKGRGSSGTAFSSDTGNSRDND